MMDVYSSPSIPFYKFGDIEFLEKIPVINWMHSFKNGFQIREKE